MSVVPQAGRRRTMLVVLVLLSITVLTFDIRGNGVIDGARQTAQDAFRPVSAFGRAVFSPFENTWHAIFDYEDLEKENEQLREQIAAAEGRVLAANQAIIDAGQLREVLDLDAHIYLEAFQTVPAEVLEATPSNFDHSIQIDAGSADGVQVGMAVIAADGVVGRITKVTGEHQSLVRLIDDPELYVGVKITTNEDLTIEQGTAHGRGRGETLVVDNISNDQDLTPGDPVFTSGGDSQSLFPPNLPLGTVESATKEPSGSEQVVRVKPNSDLENLAFVRVILYLPTP
jgi:rod shape-determining protein MreC